MRRKMKYKPVRDLPRFAREYKTISPSQLAEIVSTKRNKKITPESITMWFKRHPSVHEQLARELREEKLLEKEDNVSRLTQGVLAELITNDYGDIKIRNLKTVEIARKLLDLIEEKLKTQKGE
jgi:ribosomal protein S19E (S16A)